MTTHHHLPDGLTPERRAHVLRNRADNFQPNPEFDQAIERMEKDPEYAETISPTTRMALGYYADDKAAHDDLND
ncbi:hypothetical protein ACH5A2_26670 [Streptomyces collinus]|uniref:hypothetical protein n=1 Tax=Streptomyces collinus TaxID=42684 RepID=UPI0037ACB22F